MLFACIPFVHLAFKKECITGGVVLSFVNALTLSLNAYTTLGFGNIPTHGLARYACVVQGFIGWFMLSIFTVGVDKSSSYVVTVCLLYRIKRVVESPSLSGFSISHGLVNKEFSFILNALSRINSRSPYGLQPNGKPCNQ